MDKEMLIEGVESQISHWREDNVIIDRGYRKYNVDVNVVETFIEDVRNGVYDVILKNDYWYEMPRSENLFSWYLFRIKSIENGIPLNNFTPENFFVFSKCLDIITNKSYSIPYINALYSPALIKLMSNNYTLKQVIDLSAVFKYLYFKKFELEELVNEVFKCCNPSSIDVKLNDQDIKLKKIKLLSKEIQNNLSSKNLSNIFVGDNSDCVVKYVKRMLISQIDISKIIELRTSAGYSNSELQGKSQSELLELVCSDINGDFSSFSDLTNEILFSNYNLPTVPNFIQEEKEKEVKILNIKLRNLINGVLFSLNQEKGVINLKEKADEIQDNYKIGEYARYISEYDNNQIKLENGEIICSIPSHVIEKTYLFWQKKYEFFYYNGTDVEFAKACTEIMCEMLISQMFLEGNKRTAKALFNSMLLSREIIPPVIDMCENDFSFFKKIANDRENQYTEICYDILQKLIKNNEQFSNDRYESTLYVKPYIKNKPSLMMMNF